MMNRIKARDRGFTLIELLVVIIIIGIIAAIAIPSFLNQRTKGFDASVASDVRSVGATIAGIEEPIAGFFPTGSQSLYAHNNSGLTTSSVVFWNDQPGVPQVSVSNKTLIEIIHVTTASGTWPRPHTASEFCITGRSAASGKYNYPGGQPRLYTNMAYYDIGLGGVVPFSKIVADYQGDRRGSCYGFAKSFLDAGGTL